MKKTLSTLVMTGLASMAQAEMTVQNVAYEIDGEPYEGLLVFDDSVSEPRPGILMVPNWMGVTDKAAEKAAKVAGSDYVVFVADMYGKGIRPKNADEAGAAATKVRSDRPVMRHRVNAALDVLRKTDTVALQTDNLLAIGFCFGGGTVLELARSGTEIKGVVSFHGNLDTPDANDAKAIKMPVLVLHGADDPTVPQEQVLAFEDEMRNAKVDWQLISYGGAVHSFSDPYAKMAGMAEYHPLVAQRAFGAMRQFFNEVLAP